MGREGYFRFDCQGRQKASRPGSLLARACTYQTSSPRRKIIRFRRVNNGFIYCNTYENGLF